MASIWAKPEEDSKLAQMAALAPEPAPTVWATPESATPAAITLPAQTPKVVEPNPMQREIGATQKALQKVQWNQANPWGTADNHPGHLGKIAHAFSTLGNIAGNIFAPNVIARIPGTQLNMQENEGELANRLNTETQTEAENEQRGAQAKNLESETAHRDDPDTTEQKPFTLPTDKGILQWDGKQWSPVQQNGETVNQPDKQSATPNMQRVAGTGADGKETFANYHPNTGQFTDQAGNVMQGFKPADKSMQGAYGSYAPMRLAGQLLNYASNENPALMPVLGPIIAHMVSSSGGGSSPDLQSVLSQIPEGQPQNSEGHAIGLRMPEAPTGATRSRGQFAESVLPSITEAQTQIKGLEKDLGPMAGRYNDLYTGKVGAYGPQFSELQTNLKNIGTAWMRLHANSEGARQEFEKVLSAAQNPANLIASLTAIDKQAQDYVKQGKGRGGNAGSNGESGAPPPGSKVRDYTTLGGKK